MTIRFTAICIWCVFALQSLTASAQVFDEEYSHWPEQTTIKGRIIISNGLQDFEQLRPVLQRASTGKQFICLKLGDDSKPNALFEELRSIKKEDGNFTVITSDDPPIKLLEAAFASAECVLIDSFETENTEIESLRPAMSDLLKRGGTLIVHAAIGERLGKRTLISPNNEDGTETDSALNLCPDSILQFGNFDRDRLLGVVKKHPRTVGIAVENETAIMLSGRKILCFGKGEATFVLPATKNQPARVASITYPASRRQSPSSYMIDLTEWRRDAIDRELPPFPVAKPETPQVKNGTLLIVGGGGSPSGLMDRFVELAGGVDKARLVYVPCSERESVGRRQGLVEAWKRKGIKHATFIHTKDRKKANTDDEFLAPLKDATGIFFGGGRQWNFSDSYYGTKAHKLMKDVLKRGGVIAGSSAGASIQARYLARATPIGNFDIMAPGYERGGLGFISGVAIDQHFTQRGRQKDMTRLMKVHPQLLGIGIDEATAIEVQNSVAKVTGRGRVFFYDTTAERDEEDPEYVALPAGSSYDLATRKTIFDAAPKNEEKTDAKK